ncbi:MAG: 6-hydroxymethylpterin diphosphokinase MptE-like protein [Alphaproteobacteria bacterium]
MSENSPGAGYFDILSKGLEAKTWRYSQLGIANAAKNLPFIDKTINELAEEAAGRTCLVVSGGPSLKRRESLERLKPVIKDFVVVASDGAIGHCLRTGITPDYIVSVDPDNTRIVRWLGDYNLTPEKLEDDYFRRQDLDAHFNTDEVERNEEQIRLVNAAGPKIKAALSTSASPEVRTRCYDSGMDVYWWNPIYDDPSDRNSATRKLFEANGVPCMNAGGNVGTSAVVFAAKILGARRVVMVGMDFSYYADTPIECTQYYGEFRSFMTDAEIPYAFKTIHNPHLGEDYYTDPAYYWYRESFLELARHMTGCEVVNATEGGILFGGNVIWRSVDDVMSVMKKEVA